MNAKNRYAKQLLRCSRCSQALIPNTDVCQKCGLRHGETVWPPSILRDQQRTNYQEPAEEGISNFFAGIVTGFFMYFFAFILLWLGGRALSKRYMPPYSDTIGIMLELMLLTLPSSTVLAVASRKRNGQPKYAIGLLCGAGLGMLALVTIFLLLIFSR